MIQDIEIKGLREVLEQLSKTPDYLFDETKEVFQQRAFAAHKEVSGHLTGSPMKSRTGLLRKSLKTEISGSTLDTLKAGIFTARKVSGQEVRYAPIHEYGGTVKAKRAYRGVPGAPYLNIPTKANLTPAGVMRWTPAQVFGSMGGYVVGQGVYIPVTVAGYADNADENVGVRVFHLVKEVKIKARLGMRDAMADEIPTLLSQLKDMRLFPS